MRTSAVFFASVLALGALFPIACTQDFGIFEPSGAATSSSGTGGSMMTTSTASSSGTGGAPDCVAGDACSDQNPCTADSCDPAQGKCAHVAVPDGPAMDGVDTPKDCLAPACMGGALMQVPNDADVPDDGNACTADTCNNGTPKNTNLDPSTSCGAGLFCDGNGACVGCVTAMQCADPGTCKSATCDMGQCKTNDTPSGTGCGGTKVCDGGGNCVGCVSDSTCTGSKICINNNCSTSCNDGMKDGKETDVDCGGACSKCGTGKMCKTGGDCASGTCTGNVCVAGPTCNDGIKNGTESDTDCGGTCATKCAVGDTCNTGADCASTTCTGGLCAASAATCADGMKNGTETDTDCGGATCGPCGNTKVCMVNTDCLSVSCVAGACAPTQCSDGTKNGMETSIDCGGTTCTKCALTKACLLNSDCLSNNCAALICAP
jgi:hypothetical protein